MIVGAYPRGTRSSQKIAAGVGTVFADAKKPSTKKAGTTPKPSGTRAEGENVRKIPLASESG